MTNSERVDSLIAEEHLDSLTPSDADFAVWQLDEDGELWTTVQRRLRDWHHDKRTNTPS